MVSFSQIRESNLDASKVLPSGLVAVSAGATSGIGELALKSFAENTTQPKIYFIGRSQEAGYRVSQELKAINAVGKYVFVKANMSLLKNTDPVCGGIKSKEDAINVLLMSQGSANMSWGYICSMMTMSLEELSCRAPEVSFIHNFANAVETSFIRWENGIGMRLFGWGSRAYFMATGKFLKLEEIGERHAWLCLSERFPSKEPGEAM